MVTVPFGDGAPGVVATGTGGWSAEAWGWSGAAGGVAAVWAKSGAGISAADSSTMKVVGRTVEALIREAQLRFIGDPGCGFATARQLGKRPTGRFHFPANRVQGNQTG
jgi:hypothetical protein